MWDQPSRVTHWKTASMAKRKLSKLVMPWLGFSRARTQVSSLPHVRDPQPSVYSPTTPVSSSIQRYFNSPIHSYTPAIAKIVKKKKRMNMVSSSSGMLLTNDRKRSFSPLMLLIFRRGRRIRRDLSAYRLTPSSAKNTIHPVTTMMKSSMFQ
jgi:hypothetical protein